MPDEEYFASLLAQAGELVVNGQLITAEPLLAPCEASAEVTTPITPDTETEGE